jgi:hypothetical protein
MISEVVDHSASPTRLRNAVSIYEGNKVSSRDRRTGVPRWTGTGGVFHYQHDPVEISADLGGDLDRAIVGNNDFKVDTIRALAIQRCKTTPKISKFIEMRNDNTQDGGIR